MKNSKLANPENFDEAVAFIECCLDSVREMELNSVPRNLEKACMRTIIGLSRLGALAQKRERKDWTQETVRLEDCILECNYLQDEIGGDQTGLALAEVIEAAECWRQHLLREEAKLGRTKI